MLYFFHHYELPVILQQAQLQQLLLRTHHGMGGMMGLAGIAALASGGAYHDVPGTGTQATPPTTQSTTQTVQNTAQSTTQTTPSVSTVQTNTTHTGDMISSRSTTPNATANDTSTTTGNQTEERAVAAQATEAITNTDKTHPGTPIAEKSMKIEEIKRKKSNEDIKTTHSSDSTTPTRDNDLNNSPSGANDDIMNKNNAKVESLTLDRRRRQTMEINEDDPVSSTATTAVKLAPRASPETDDLD
ncbi:unnamed protein product [Euphydryas editha]|uniref:Uncharacterized protein n=1 Tax=Euphydryas editha TaxID=104508 RepID=A0AAU9TUF1_EUPED|nr:unnamed protein product [Euphydryas editha]